MLMQSEILKREIDLVIYSIEIAAFHRTYLVKPLLGKVDLSLAANH